MGWTHQPAALIIERRHPGSYTPAQSSQAIKSTVELYQSLPMRILLVPDRSDRYVFNTPVPVSSIKQRPRVSFRSMGVGPHKVYRKKGLRSPISTSSWSVYFARIPASPSRASNSSRLRFSRWKALRRTHAMMIPDVQIARQKPKPTGYFGLSAAKKILLPEGVSSTWTQTVRDTPKHGRPARVRTYLRCPRGCPC